MSTEPKAEAGLSNKAVDALYGIAGEIYEELDGGQIPKMKIPLRTKANIRFDTKHAVWKYGNLMGVRSAKKLKGALMLLRTMHVLEFIRDMIRENKSSTLRRCTTSPKAGTSPSSMRRRNRTSSQRTSR